MRLGKAIALASWDMLCLVLAVVVAGCGSPLPRPVAPPPPTTSAGLCTSEELIPPYLCNLVTLAEHYECALCGQRQCVTTSFVYCVGDQGCDDPACGPRTARTP
jgi:hypothetical protein